MTKGAKGFQKGHPPYSEKGQFKKGNRPWNYGMKMSEEFCEMRRRVTQGKNSPNFGKKLSSETKNKIRKSHLLKGEDHHCWKGNDVGMSGLHLYVRIRIPKPDFCEECKIVPPLDLANKSGKYKRDLNDWEWLCRRCHMIKDGRLENFKKTQIQRKKNKMQ